MFNKYGIQQDGGIDACQKLRKKGNRTTFYW